MDWWEEYIKTLNSAGQFWEIPDSLLVDSVFLAKDNTFPRSEPVSCQLAVQPGCGTGVVAGEDVTSGSFVLEYIGEIICNRRHSFREDKTFTMSAVSWLYDCVIDASVFGNITRYVNHSCDPNCKVVVKVKNQLPAPCLFAIKDIKQGDFITYDYYPHEEELSFAHFDGGCKCGTNICKFK